MSGADATIMSGADAKRPAGSKACHPAAKKGRLERPPPGFNFDPYGQPDCVANTVLSNMLTAGLACSIEEVRLKTDMEELQRLVDAVSKWGNAAAGPGSSYRKVQRHLHTSFL